MKLTILCLACILWAMFVGCASAYKAMGLSTEQAAIQAVQDRAAAEGSTQEARDALAKALAGEQAPMIEVLETGRVALWQAVSAAIAAAGAGAGALLSKYLGTERRMTAALIAGVEKTEGNGVKELIQVESKSRGVSAALQKRVDKQT